MDKTILPYRPCVGVLLARADGRYVLAGTYFVGGDGVDFRNSSSAFDIAIPLTDLEPATVAAAQARAILTLAEDIAGSLGR